ncbi:hypothetical protein CAPTEDRAFT_209265 [Capitella teleta]|uniref:Uncharacterized protein n=1 Tax=Capitella teleta TaxID=283909 RepID=R7UFU7_CAPTE|nr:hypothetical protein CAPTEDRAFT_209265 [Capitella teleta]|eukprot:ELU02162.1 hypothetical protein CAPTEDRAFT_209265 [Capitella teleta]
MANIGRREIIMCSLFLGRYKDIVKYFPVSYHSTVEQMISTLKCWFRFTWCMVTFQTYVDGPSHVLPVVVGAAIAAALFLTFASLLIWWFYRKRHGYSPSRGPRLTSSREDGRDSALEGDELPGSNDKSSCILKAILLIEL